MSKEGEKPTIRIEKATKADIPKIVQMSLQESVAVLPLDANTVSDWIDKGHSFVAKTDTGHVVGHQAASLWEVSKWIEVRGAVVEEPFRGQGINTQMKKGMIETLREEDPEVVICGFTESGSMSRGILQKLDFQPIPMDDVPEEFFDICPANCVKKTGIDCGCKVYALYPETKDDKK